ncbi:sugar phosphate isomerase/epimerase family protein [Haloferula sargassicola]|uniref:Sugar phosphate isomerase/epimerase n=1 Tax=Haloferula sargassicola TaxID=490096 RepID=A0ABP9UM98_9BACT
MKLLLFKTLWGHEGSLSEAVAHAREDGFDGIEGPVPPGREKEWFDRLAGLPWIAEICTCTPPGFYIPEPGRSPAEHLDSLARSADAALGGSPLFLTTMAGWDAWNFSEMVGFLEGVVELEAKLGAAIRVETHRTRCTYSPWITRELLRELPEIRLTCDFSHWCVVTERLVLDEDPGLLDLVADCAAHIHARVGHAQGPQVIDPRAPMHATDLEAHTRWWRHLWKTMAARGETRVTMTPEAGPDGYQPCDLSGRPLANLREVNRWMAAHLRAAFPGGLEE